MDSLKYPIGRFKKPATISAEHLQTWLQEIEQLPALMKEVINPLSEEDLNKTYRPDGWTIRQVVHHVADSHINAYTRFKWTLTEDNPTIKAYHEDRWATLEDVAATPVEVSLHLLAVLHFRWTVLMRSLSEEELKRAFFHPENKKTYSLDEMIGLYAWHGAHHLAHIKLALL